MNVLFAHDHRFVRDREGNTFTQGSFPSSIWSRYLKHFSSIRVVARRDPAEDPDGLARADAESVEFTLVSQPGKLARLGIGSGPLTSLIAVEVARADAVIARLPSDIGLLALTEARSQGKPTAIETVGCAYDGYGNFGTLTSRVYASFAFRRMRSAIAKTSFVHYVTESWLQKRYPPAADARTVHASNLQISLDMTVDAQREARLVAIEAGEPPIFGTVASLQTGSKGLQTMIAALGQRRRAGLAPVTWRVLGPGDPSRWRRMAIEHGVNDQVLFDGSRPAGPDVLKWLDEIDVHCQPSFQEGLPRATIEAMSRGCACLGSTAGGIPELLPLERTHEPGNVKQLAEFIEIWRGSPSRIRAASERDRCEAYKYDTVLIEQRRSSFFAAFAAHVQYRKTLQTCVD